MLLANLAAGSAFDHLPAEVLETWGIGYDSFFSGNAFRIVTGTFLSHDPAMLLRQLVFAGAVIGHTEWRRGSARAAALFFGLDIAGTLALLALTGWSAGLVDLTAVNDVGMSVGGFGLIGVAIAGWDRRWLLLCAISLAIAAKYAISPDPLADLGHILALVIGFALGAILPTLQGSAREETARAR
ncbi:MAG: hypothetical protein H6895_13130 [Defluviimonas sp.]|nr:hypothetical protein [Paracoccaceae bacterium]MCC0065014.1 hypothetical protein [Defluviimonas sp.]